jgi:hypothetical protein
MQEALERLTISKTRTAPLYPQSVGIMELFVAVVEHLKKVVSNHKRDWDERLPIFPLD